MGGIRDALGEEPDDFLVTLAVRGGDIIVDAKVATLEYRVDFGKLIHFFLVQVKDTAVVLPHALDQRRRDKTSADEVLQCALGNPGGIPDVAFPSRKLPDEIGVDQLQILYVLKDTPNGMPVDAGILHGHLFHPMIQKKLVQFFQFWG